MEDYVCRFKQMQKVLVAIFTIDHLSNGFKIRTSGAASMNASGGTYMYMAFAENPFTTSTGIPATAR